MKNKLYLSLNILSIVFLFVCVFFAPFLKAQEKISTSEIITTNFDSIENKIYVWMRYAPAGGDTCLLNKVDTILFRLQKKDAALGQYVPVGTNGYDVINLIGFHSDPTGAVIDHTYTNGSETFSALAVSTEKGLPGYGLLFSLVGEALELTPEDSISIILEVKYPPIRCRWCGVGHSDILINPFTDIDPLCPYPKTDTDLIYCKKRRGGAKNWEGYIRDPRDCRIYRIVQMPHNIGASTVSEQNHWWFAKNLNYQKGLRSSQNFLPGSDLYKSVGTGPLALSSTIGYFFCPQHDGASVDPTMQYLNGEGNITTTNGTNLADEVAHHPGGSWSCEVYGALYGVHTIRALDGNGVSTNNPSISNAIPASTTRGVCPKGWSIPSDQHWGVMLNAVDGCETPITAKSGEIILGDTCGHFRSDINTLTNTGVVSIENAASISPAANAINNIVTPFNNMTGGSTTSRIHQRIGKRAGVRLKAAATCPARTHNCDNFSSNTNTNYGIFTNGVALGEANAIRTTFSRWMYAREANSGIDYYGFSVIPAGAVFNNGTSSNTTGQVARGRGQFANFITFTGGGGGSRNILIYRMFEYDKATVNRHVGNNDAWEASYVFSSVRCIKL
ncbi:MAG: hypothetical protein ACRCSB_03250 [Bacteroidales bacterium]